MRSIFLSLSVDWPLAYTRHGLPGWYIGRLPCRVLELDFFNRYQKGPLTIHPRCALVAFVFFARVQLFGRLHRRSIGALHWIPFWYNILNLEALQFEHGLALSHLTFRERHGSH
jgi:hypothetical protein